MLRRAARNVRINARRHPVGPLPRGLAMGAAAHGIGTAQMGSEPEAQPFAAIAMSLVGAASVVAASLPPTRAALRAVAGV